MPTYRLHRLTAALLLTDTPVGYAPPRGPAMFFTLRYDSRQVIQPDVRTYGHVGRQWTHDWLGYVYEIPAYCETGSSATNYCFPARANVYLRGGGEEVFSGADAAGVYPRHWRTQAQLVRVSVDPIRYEQQLPDGTVEVYAVPDTAPAGQRRIFLSEVRDPQGQSVAFTYDALFRLVALTDALGQVTTLTYADPADPLRLTQVTDPFGRSASLTYTDGGQVASITDVLGLTSRMVYQADQVTLLVTPYGTTSFSHGTDFYNPWVQATDALGGTERLEYRWETTAWPASEVASEVPEGFEAQNAGLHQYTSVYWDKAAWAKAPASVATATLTRWLLAAWSPYATPEAVSVPHSLKRPLERRVWYRYPGQLTATRDDAVHEISQPSEVARVLDDGTLQRTLATYNTQGQVLSRADPIGRETTYAYAANGVDLLEVRQMRPGGYDVLALYGNYTAGHQPQTVTDAAGQTSTLTYNAAGQLLTSTNAKQEATTYTYDANGRLQTVSAALAGATTTYAYDGYGRVWTVTGPDGYAVTSEYDTFDRPWRTTYPDGTYEETIYDRLDAKSQRDRLGRQTQYFYDELRRLRASRDPAGRTVSRSWVMGGCASGCASRDTLTDGKGQTTTWERDVQGRVMREVRADGVTATLYTYQPAAGRLATVTDPKLQVTTYAYAVDDSVIGITFTNAVVATPGVSYTYDPVYNRVATMVDGTGTTAYTYHPAATLGAGQVATVDGPLTNDTIAYSYDELGRVLSRSINGAANTTTQVYDALGRVATETNVLGTFTYTYVGATGRLQLVTYPNGQTSSYDYFDTLGDLRLQTIHHRKPDTSTLSKFDYTYDAAGNILTWQQQADSAAPTIWRYGYDRGDQLTAAVHETTDPTPAIIKRYAYSYDPAGNRTSEQIDDAVTLATHDNLNRLLTHQPGGVLTFKGTLNEPATVTVNGKPATVDATNRFTAGVPVAAGTNAITINAVDASGNATEAVYEVDQSGPEKTFTYDANGNMTSDGTRTFEWDARNQLVAVNVGSHRTELKYDGSQRRVREVEIEDSLVQSETTAIWCQGRVYETRAADGLAVRRRSLANGEQVMGESRYFAVDHLGSVTTVTDGAVSVMARYAYDPWGSRTLTAGSDITDVGFTAHRWHSATAAWLARYRMLDPRLGRWASEEPLGLAEGPNFYTYVANRPPTAIDADGRAGTIAAGVGIGGVVGGPAGAVVGGLIGAGLGLLIGNMIWERVQPICTREKPRFQPDEKCKKVKQDCVAKCSDTALPTHDYGFAFWNCVNKCMAEANCY
jgi:RHS repeat-associated protein